MKEKKIIAAISTYACLILANTTENKNISLMYIIIAFIWLVMWGISIYKSK